MTDLKTTIEKLISIVNDPNCSRMNKSTVKGYLGELMIKILLEEEGCSVDHKGNQSNYDLEVVSPFNSKIDVKFSSVKGTKKYPDFGWALKHSNKKDLKASHFVCVGVDRDFSDPLICIINAKFVDELKANDKRFKTVLNSFSIPITGDIIDYREGEYFENCKKMVENGCVMILNSGNKLIDYLK